MAITFPSSPSDQDTYTYAGKTYIYNASRSQWQVVSTTIADADLSSVMTNIVPASNVAYSLGTAEKAWSDLYVSGNTIHLGSTSLSVDAEGGLQTSVGGQAVKIGGGSTEYANTSVLPTNGNQNGDLAYVVDNASMYLWNGLGWFKISTVNLSPVISGLANSYDIVSSTFSINAIATDPEGLPITWSYETTGNTDHVTITDQSNGTFDMSFSNFGTFSIIVKATDGVNIASKTVPITRQMTSVQQIIDNGYSSGIYTIIDPNTGTEYTAYVDTATTDGWMLYSSFANDNTYDATNYPAVNGNRILYGDLSTYDWVPTTLVGSGFNYADGVTDDLSGYSRTSEAFTFFFSSTSRGYLQNSVWNGPTNATKVRVHWGANLNSDVGLYINNVKVVDSTSSMTITEHTFDPSGATPLIGVYEGFGSIAAIREVWFR